MGLSVGKVHDCNLVNPRFAPWKYHILEPKLQHHSQVPAGAVESRQGLRGAHWQTRGPMEGG